MDIRDTMEDQAQKQARYEDQVQGRPVYLDPVYMKNLFTRNEAIGGNKGFPKVVHASDYLASFTTKTKVTRRLNMDGSKVSWLAEYLSHLGFTEEWITVCDRILVHDHGIATREIFMSIPSHVFSPDNLAGMGITAIGLQYAIYNLHTSHA